MSYELFTRTIDELAGLEELHLQGLGEPLMHPRFFDMVRYAADKGIHVTTNSNLTLLNERRAAACVASGLDALHVSIDGATAET
jgi:MoaA/NifB/PqqE/SkfB family radical SAM enzyme